MISGTDVNLSGSVSGESAAAMQIDFTGAANGMTMADECGFFDLTTSASALGTITAMATDDQGQASSPVTAELSSTAPLVSLEVTPLADGQTQISGTVTDDGSVAGLLVDLGGVITQTLPTDGNGVYSITLAAVPPGPVTATATDVWGLVSNVAQAEVTGGSSDALTFEAFGLVNDSGFSNSDQVTNAPAVAGSVSWNAQNITDIAIEFDHQGDGTEIYTASASMTDGSFSFDPLAVDATLATWEGPLTLRYRAVAQTDTGPIESTWTDFNLTLDLVAPEVTAFDPTDPGTYDLALGGPITVTFNEEIDSSSVALATVWIESDSSGIAPSSQMLSATFDQVQIAVDPAELTDPWYKTWADGVTDLAGNLMVPAVTLWATAGGGGGGGAGSITLDLDGNNDSGATDPDFLEWYGSQASVSDVVDDDLIIDSSGLKISKATIKITNVKEAPFLEYLYLDTTSIPAGYDSVRTSSNTILTITTTTTGAGTVDDYKALLKNTHYQNNAVNPFLDTRNITIELVSDLETTATSDDVKSQATALIEINSPPVGAIGDATGSIAFILGSHFDPANGGLSSFPYALTMANTISDSTLSARPRHIFDTYETIVDNPNLDDGQLKTAIAQN